MRTSHLPFPMPERKFSLQQNWVDLTFMHWEVDPDILRKHIPDDLEIDITSLAIGDVIKVDDIKVASELEIKTSPEQTIASVTHAMKEETVVEPEEEADFIDGESEETPVEDSGKEASDGNTENNEG